ncbi:recombinase RecT [Tenacibaculum maritimum]|nr:RecT family recombinase [Tenacibaculum maritimum]MDB0600290.1 recombinase RecT [Tenacibaculum maritimum]MDB0602113.1 recombinase RecT [Tenacibaculum maritimum]MDB0610801.1 recombinase RecT [Tenacibaculum maritimum]
MSTEQLTTTSKKDISAQVLSKIETFKSAGQLKIPKDYSPENALKSAYLILAETKNKAGKYALQHCSKESVANALLKMVVWGLSPLKKQCDFIMYGDKLDCSIEYTGNIALAKRYGGLKSIKANAIFKDDEFAFEVDPMSGLKKVSSHKQTIESIGSKDVKGAYAVIELHDGTVDVEIMSIEQIRSAWNQGAMKGQSPAHKNFPDQMAMKTVINRACKLLIRGSDDNILYDETVKEPGTIDVVAEDVNYEIEENSNKKELGFQEAETVQEERVEEVKETPNQEVTADPGF